VSAFEDLVARQRRAVAAGRCACLCGERIDMVAGIRNASERCRQRAYRERMKARAEDLDVPVTLTMESVRTGGSTRTRNGDAVRRRTPPMRKRRVDLRIPLSRLTARLAELDLDADAITRPLLTDRQRQEVERERS
jgi:hypothetical protein